MDKAGGDQWLQQKRDSKDKGVAINSLNDIKTIFYSLLYPKDNKIVDQTFQVIEQKTSLKREKVILVNIFNYNGKN